MPSRHLQVQPSSHHPPPLPHPHPSTPPAATATRRATAGFHPSCLLGLSAASPVYLATFLDAFLAAAKTRASPHELHVLASLPPDPPRLVSLFGYAGSGADGQPLLLVFEYPSQGSLQGAFFGDGRCLDWAQRRGVVGNVARVLAFLHAECQPPVVAERIGSQTTRREPRIGPTTVTSRIHPPSPTATSPMPRRLAARAQLAALASPHLCARPPVTAAAARRAC